jgi:hypothetical protein
MVGGSAISPITAKPARVSSTRGERGGLCVRMKANGLSSRIRVRAVGKRPCKRLAKLASAAQ